MVPYTTSKSNLATQELDEETLAALNLHPPEKVFQTLLRNLEKQEQVEETQRTGDFGARSTYRGKEPASRLQPLFHQMSTMIQRATDDNRNYTVEIKVVANITVEPWEAEIGEYVHRGHFLSNPIPPDRKGNQLLEIRITNCTQVYTFQPTRQGYQRIE